MSRKISDERLVEITKIAMDGYVLNDGEIAAGYRDTISALSELQDMRRAKSPGILGHGRSYRCRTDEEIVDDLMKRRTGFGEVRRFLTEEDVRRIARSELSKLTEGIEE